MVHYISTVILFVYLIFSRLSQGTVHMVKRMDGCGWMDGGMDPDGWVDPFILIIHPSISIDGSGLMVWD